jgi:curved DNA-binding protein CbpA
MMAKKYHPDVYDGINKDHFRKVNEAYSTLKMPSKRADYDRRLKIKSSHAADHHEDGSEQPQRKETKTREYQDPEFEAAFQKLNTKRMFN